MPSHDFDTLIIGGGPAGLSAALYLGRSRKRVAVLDAGEPRHRVSQAVHNMISRDGISPQMLRSTTWEQLRAYPGITHIPDTTITKLEQDPDTLHWSATTREGESYTAATALLATGIVDEHPNLPGYEQFWGHTIQHCPYCHGWELQDRPLALLGHGEAIDHMAPLLKGWSDDLLVLTHGEPLAHETEHMLDQIGVSSYQARVIGLEGEGAELQRIMLEDGTTLERRGLFVAGAQHPVQLVASLDLEMNGAYIKVDEMQKTSLPNLWAAGDLCSRMQQVIFAATQGGIAATQINAVLTLSH